MATTVLCAHDGHAHMPFETRLESFIYWLGTFHPLFLSFPIALITMTVFSELLFWKTNNPLFEHAARFMILAGAILAVPTVITGFAFSYNSSYPPSQESFFWWHRFFGLFVLGFAIITAYIREYKGRHALYFLFLAAAFISVVITGFNGGNLTFQVVKATSQMIQS